MSTTTTTTISGPRALDPNAYAGPMPKVRPHEFAAVVDRDALLAALTNSCLAKSGDDSRPILTGVLMQRHPDVADALQFVATDSYRLAVTVVRTEGPREPFAPIILADVGNLLRAVKSLHAAELVRIDVEGREFEAERTVSAWRVFPNSDRVDSSDAHPIHAARCIAGDYPKWKGLVPSPATFAEPKVGAPAFNPKFLADVGKLRHPDYAAKPSAQADAGPIRMNWVDNLKPAVFSFGAYSETSPVRYLLMPVRTND